MTAQAKKTIIRERFEGWNCDMEEGVADARLICTDNDRCDEETRRKSNCHEVVCFIETEKVECGS